MGKVQEQITRARQLERARDYAGALDAFLAASGEAGPHGGDPAFWLALGAAAERVNRRDAIADAYGRAIGLLEGRGAVNGALAVAGRLVRAVGEADSVVRQGEIALRLGYAPLARDAFLAALDRSDANGGANAAIEGLIATWRLLRERGMETEADAVRQRVVAIAPDRDPLTAEPHSAPPVAAEAFTDGQPTEQDGDASTLPAEGMQSLAADLPPLSLDHDDPRDSTAEGDPPAENTPGAEADEPPTLAGGGLDSLAADLASFALEDDRMPPAVRAPHDAEGDPQALGQLPGLAWDDDAGGGDVLPEADDVVGEQDLPLLGADAFAPEHPPHAEARPPTQAGAADAAEHPSPPDDSADAAPTDDAGSAGELDLPMLSADAVAPPTLADRPAGRGAGDATPDGPPGSGDEHDDLGLNWDFTSAVPADGSPEARDDSGDITLDPGLMPPGDSEPGDTPSGSSDDDLGIVHPEELGYGLRDPEPDPGRPRPAPEAATTDGIGGPGDASDTGQSIAEDVAGLFSGHTGRARGGPRIPTEDGDPLPPAEDLDLEPAARAGTPPGRDDVARDALPARPSDEGADPTRTPAAGGEPWATPPGEGADTSRTPGVGEDPWSGPPEGADASRAPGAHDDPRTRSATERADPYEPRSAGAADDPELAPAAPSGQIPDAARAELDHAGARPGETGKARDPEPPPPDSVEGEFIDLAALILGEDDDPGTRFQTDAAGEPSGDEDHDFAEILAIFRREVSQKIHPQDSSSHYDLGIAYKEMGLLDDAIAQLQLALRAGANPVATLEVIGECFIEKGECSLARRVLERALQVQGASESDLVGVLYWLGRCEELLARPMEATAYYERVVAVDISFRDAAERLRGLNDATH